MTLIDPTPQTDIVSPYAITIGAASVDILGTPMSALKPQNSIVGEISISAGGVGFNIASNLALLTKERHNYSRFISVLGDDANAAVIRQQAQTLGVDLQLCQQLTDAKTSVYLSVLDTQKDMHVAINDMAIYQQLTSEVLACHAMQIDQAELLILDANLSATALAYLFDQHKHTAIFVDAVSATKAVKMRDYLADIDTLKVNLTEAEALSNIVFSEQKKHDISSLTATAAWFHQQGLRRIFITLAAQGMFYSEIDFVTANITSRKIPALPISIENGNGAGDAVVAALAYGFSQQLTTEQTARYATAAAAIALSHQATVHPNMSVQLLETTLKKHENSAH
jgi:pseudouridine kinase